MNWDIKIKALYFIYFNPEVELYNIDEPYPKYFKTNKKTIKKILNNVFSSSKVIIE